MQKGTFTINGSKIVATYTSGDSTTGNVKAYVTAEGTIRQSTDTDTEGGKTSFEFPGFGTVDVDVKPVHSVQAIKNGAVSTDDPTVFYYVVDVTSTGTNTNVNLKDTMGNLLTLLNDADHPIEIYKNAQLTEKYDGGWSKSNVGDHGFTVNIDQMADGETVRLKYYVKIDRKSVIDATKNGNVDLINNKVVYHSDEDLNNKETNKKLEISTNWYVNKGGTTKVDPITGKSVIEWKVIIGGGGDTAGKVTVKDILGDGLKKPDPNSTVTIQGIENDWNNPATTKTVTWQELENGTAVLPTYPGGKAYPFYQIVYQTELATEPGIGNSKQYSNSFEVTPEEGKPSAGGGTVTVTRNSVDLAKQYVSTAEDGKTMSWLTTFTALEKLPADQVLTDTLDKQQDGTIAGDFQKIKPGSIKLYTDADQKQPYASANYKIALAKDRKSFTITFKNELAKGTKIYIAYQSVMNNGVSASETFYNTANFAGKDVTASHTNKVDNLTKSNTYQYYDPTAGTDNQPGGNSGRFRWLLTVHDIASGTKSVSITDTLPTNNKKTVKHIYISGSARAVDPSGVQVDGMTATDNGDGTVTFTITPGTPAFKAAQTSTGLRIIYDTTFDGLIGVPSWDQYTNSAKITVDGKEQLPDTATEGGNPPSILVKKGTYSAATAPYINYSISVNSTAAQLNKGETLTLTDTMGEALALRMDSVRIVDTKTKADVAGASYAYDPTTRTTTFKIPDGRAITIEYKASVLLKPGESFTGSLGANKVVLKGSGVGETTSTQTQTGVVQKALGGISSENNALQIYKYADGDTGKPLNGAVFKVEQLSIDADSQANKGKQWTYDATKSTTVTSNLTSAANGYTPTVALNPDIVYKVTETREPEGGYQLGADTVWYVVFPGNDHVKNDTYDGFYDGVTIDGHSLIKSMTTVESTDKNGTVTSKPIVLQTYMLPVSNQGRVKKSFTLFKTDEGGTPLAGAKFELTKDGDASFATQTWDADGKTSHTFTDLTPGTYTLTETKAPDGYETAKPVTIVVTDAGKVIVDGKDAATGDAGTNGDKQNVVTVADSSETTKIRATKIWDDGDGRDGGRGTVTFQLWKKVGDGEATHMAAQDKVIRPSAIGDDLTVEWGNLPVMEQGKSVTYEVREQYQKAEGGDKADYTQGPVTDCTASDADQVTHYCVTNTHTPAVTQIAVRKVWDDADNADKLRPNDVTVRLYANGKATDKTVALNEKNGWKATFDNLPKYENGNPISYTVKEDDVPAKYTVAVTGSASAGFVVTNTHHPESEEIYISKRDLGGTEIAGVGMKLSGTLADGSTFKTITWTSKAGASHAEKLKPGTYRLEETKAPTGYRTADPIDFTVEQDEKTGKLTIKVDGKPLDGNTIVMTDEYQTRRVTVSKKSLTDGVGEIKGAKLEITGTTLAGEDYSFPWTTDGTNKLITLNPGTYTLHESEAPAGYRPASDIVFNVNLDGTVTINGKEQDNNKIVMIDEPDETNVTVSKVAVSGTAELPGAEFKLTGTTFENDSVRETWTSSADGPKSFQLPNGTYKLEETKAPTGYDLIAEPIEFTVHNGKVIIDGVAQSGNVIRVEDAAKQYVSMSVRKRWEDQQNRDGVRTGVTVYAQLYANGKPMKGDQYRVKLYECPLKTTDQTKTQNDTQCPNTAAAHDWTDLPAKDAQGNRIVYTVDEELWAAEGYQGNLNDEYHNSISKKPGLNGYEFTMTNIHQPDSTSIEIVKHWDDGDDQDGLRPDGIGIIVYGDATCKVPGPNNTTVEQTCSDQLITTTLEPNGNGEWKWTLENLPKNNADGNPYTFRVVEDPIDGYNGYDENGQCTAANTDGTVDDSAEGSADGKKTCAPVITVIEPGKTGNEHGKFELFTITNKHTPATVAVTVNKIWEDQQNFNEQRPGSVTLWLLSSVWTGSNGWPVPQYNASENDKCASDNTDIWGRSCIVLTKANAKKIAASDGSVGTAADSDTADGSDSSGDATGTTTDPDVWTYTFENLPKYYKGKLIRYSVTEQRVPNYQATITDTTGKALSEQTDQTVIDTATSSDESTGDGTTADEHAAPTVNAYDLSVTNTNQPDTASLTVYKAWNDYDNAESKRPVDSAGQPVIYVQLYQCLFSGTTETINGVETTACAANTNGASALQNVDSTMIALGAPVKLIGTGDNPWSHTFNYYTDAQGVAHKLSAHKTYVVREVDKDGNIITLPGYESPIITGDQDTGYTITNTIAPVLPDTGGNGIVRTMLIGFAMIVLSGVFFARQYVSGTKHSKKGGSR
ncbi:Cna B-type domain-containing protein [Bifidobacterium biavatii]|uniref:Collagen-binding protein A n=1 Tax=Bifidobacterium biavatii DSM 23969 TaxID=1437608 RepID=A0A086ZSR2_9BIFI|nr:Cna B-type domain-containing protein [Bifidobacterium biavatii]KFI49562.1 collagen-binding protein A [Bifidobacterium biavatii DSM 23969]